MFEAQGGGVAQAQARMSLKIIHAADGDEVIGILLVAAGAGKLVVELGDGAFDGFSAVSSDGCCLAARL